LIDEGFLDTNSVDDLANKLGIGTRHLSRLFAKHAGASPTQAAATARVQRAKRMINGGTMSLTSIAFAAGFQSVRRFNDVFKALYGKPPSSFRR
jgi:AraC family transcriptional regulator of adaptative response / DNA-3-methyladenine glycosylase II